MKCVRCPVQIEKKHWEKKTPYKRNSLSQRISYCGVTSMDPGFVSFSQYDPSIPNTIFVLLNKYPWWWSTNSQHTSATASAVPTRHKLPRDAVSCCTADGASLPLCTSFHTIGCLSDLFTESDTEINHCRSRLVNECEPWWESIIYIWQFSAA